VANKAGDAALKAGKYAWEGLKGVDYGKLWDNTTKFAGNVYDAN